MKQKAVSKLPKDISYEEAVQILQGQTAVPVAQTTPKRPGNIENNTKLLVLIKHLLKEVLESNEKNRPANVTYVIDHLYMRPHKKQIQLEFFVDDPNNEI